MRLSGMNEWEWCGQKIFYHGQIQQQRRQRWRFTNLRD